MYGKYMRTQIVSTYTSDPVVYSPAINSVCITINPTISHLPNLPLNIKYLELRGKYDESLSKLPKTITHLYIHLERGIPLVIPDHVTHLHVEFCTSSIILPPNIKALALDRPMDITKIITTSSYPEVINYYHLTEKYINILHSPYMYYLIVKLLILSNNNILQKYNSNLEDIRKRQEINRYNKIQRQSSIFDSLLE